MAQIHEGKLTLKAAAAAANAAGDTATAACTSSGIGKLRPNTYCGTVEGTENRRTNFIHRFPI